MWQKSVALNFKPVSVVKTEVFPKPQYDKLEDASRGLLRNIVFGFLKFSKFEFFKKVIFNEKMTDFMMLDTIGTCNLPSLVDFGIGIGSIHCGRNMQRLGNG